MISAADGTLLARYDAAPAWKKALALRIATNQLLPTDRYYFDPGLILSEADMPPYDWQREVLESRASQLLLACARQVGKTWTVGGLAVKTALIEAPAMILLLAPTLRQSGELFRDKVLKIYRRIGRPVKLVRESATEIELENGSRIVALPENEIGVVGFSSVNLLVLDEASRVGDELYKSVRPMLAASRGRIVLLSSPYGKRGFFFDEWEKGGDAWRRWKVRADQCPHYTPEFLAGERRSMGDRWYRQDYEVSFEDAIDAVFTEADIQGMLRDDIEPMRF